MRGHSKRRIKNETADEGLKLRRPEGKKGSCTVSSIHKRNDERNPYTSPKLNLIKAARFDRTVSDFELRVLGGLAEHINRQGIAEIYDERLATEIGCKWPQSIQRARLRLRDKGYIAWRRTSERNVYSFNYAKAKPLLDSGGRVECMLQIRYRFCTDYTRETHYNVSSAYERTTQKHTCVSAAWWANVRPPSKSPLAITPLS